MNYWPTCSVCNKPVDQVSEHGQLGQPLRIVVRCHGQQETIEVADPAEADKAMRGFVFPSRPAPSSAIV